VRYLFCFEKKQGIIKELNRGPWVNDSQRTTYTVSLFRFNLKAMTGVAVVTMVEMDVFSSSSALARSTPTDFLHRKTHGQQRRRASVILRSAASSVAAAVPVMAVPFSSFTSWLSHEVQDLKIIVVQWLLHRFHRRVLGRDRKTCPDNNNNKPMYDECGIIFNKI